MQKRSLQESECVTSKVCFQSASSDVTTSILFGRSKFYFQPLTISAKLALSTPLLTAHSLILVYTTPKDLKDMITSGSNNLENQKNRNRLGDQVRSIVLQNY